MRSTPALAHYLRLLNEMDAIALNGSESSSASTRYRWQTCGRAPPDRMARSRETARQRRLHLLSCRMRDMKKDDHPHTQLEFELREAARLETDPLRRRNNDDE